MAAGVSYRAAGFTGFGAADPFESFVLHPPGVELHMRETPAELHEKAPLHKVVVVKSDSKCYFKGKDKNEDERDDNGKTVKGDDIQSRRQWCVARPAEGWKNFAPF